MTTDMHEIHETWPEGEVWLDADAARLEQVVMNLLNNAIRYSPGGGPIDVELSRDDDEARIIVRDRGIGIAPDALPRIFERFFRASTEVRDAGMGIGLFIARGIVEEHGGRIEAASEGNRGARFTVTLPAIAAA